MQQRDGARRRPIGRLRRHFSYANVMATIAVFGVLGGGAYAASKIGAGDIKKNAVRAKHVKKGAVKTPKIANRAVKGAKLGRTAIVARAYGQIAWPGAVRDDRSKNVADENVSSPEAGVYCISGLPFTPKNAVATNAEGYNAGRSYIDIWLLDTSASACPLDTQIEVRTFSEGTGNPDSTNFNIVIF